MNNRQIIVITGPTASGKSALAVSLAKKLNTEIISADSRQIYKDIPIVTAVPTYEERQGIQHHLLECLELEDYYSASLFSQDVELKLDLIFQKSNFAIICGGSMLYIDAFVNGIDDLPTVPNSIRETLMAEWGKYGNEWLLNRLLSIDPDYYKRVDRNNLKRVFHAIEISETAGVPYSSLLSSSKVKNNTKRNYDINKFILSGSREILFDKINSRVIHMMKNGLEEEARKAYSKRHLNSLNTVGLKEMFTWFDGLFTKTEAIARIQKNTRVYAKKQETWNKRDKKAEWLDFTTPIDINVDKILKFIHH